MAVDFVLNSLLTDQVGTVKLIEIEGETHKPALRRVLEVDHAKCVVFARNFTVVGCDGTAASFDPILPCKDYAHAQTLHYGRRVRSVCTAHPSRPFPF
jgi:hypothetical protein